VYSRSVSVESDRVVRRGASGGTSSGEGLVSLDKESDDCRLEWFGDNKIYDNMVLLQVPLCIRGTRTGLYSTVLYCTVLYCKAVQYSTVTQLATH
jgi:hypothetical protein